MIELLMVYCMAGEPCTTETLAIFPQPDVGSALCEIARPAIASAIRAKAPTSASVTFSCAGSAMQSVQCYEPIRRSDERYRMIEAESGTAVDKVLELINRVSK